MRFPRTLDRSLARLPFALVLLPASLAAQGTVVKPTTTTTATYTRLPAPGPVVAKQQPDGSILVTWRAIPGAASYQVTRSVPPAAAQVVASPTDSTYVDTNVQPGSQYYYMVAAVSSGGALGLKSGSQPVTATATVAPTLVASGTSGTAGGGAAGGATPPTTLVAPLAVEAIAQGSYPFNVVFFGFKQNGLTYRIERGLYSAKSATPSSWQLRQTTGPLPCCTWAIIDTLTGVTGSVMYRVTAVDPANPAAVSPPTTSRWINPTPQPSNPTLNGFYLPDAAEISRTDKVGTTLPLDPTGIILDRNGVLTRDSRGFPVAAAPGVGHYLWGALSSSGMPIVQVVRVTVIP